MQTAHSIASAGENWPRDALPQGTLVYGYRIESILGRGGFGITYRVLDRIEQSFALKECFPRQFAVRQGMEVLPADPAAAESLQDCLGRFIREARALLQLSQRGAAGDTAVKVVTFFETNGTAYLVMEFLEGESLEQRIRATPQGIPEERLSRILQGVLHAVGCAHDAGLLHRDIKPSNILLRQDGRPVLIDFGAVRAVTGGGQTQTFTQIYSESYAPIEQISGAAQGPYSDLYAIGATFYQAIGGTPINALTRQVATMSGKPDPLLPAATIGAGRYSQRLLAAIDAALSIPASERPQTAPDFLALLSAAGSEESATRLAGPSSLEDTRTRISPRPLNRSADGGALGREARGESGKQPASERAALRSPAGCAPVSPSPGRRESPALEPAPGRRIVLFGALATAAVAAAAVFVWLYPRMLPPGARLEVRTTPSGASLNIDGRTVGTAPLGRYKIKPGRHKIEADLPGYRAKSIFIDVEPGQRLHENLQLAPKPAELDIVTSPLRAALRIDDQSVGPAPLRGYKIKPGRHKIEADLTGYQAKSIFIDVEPGQSLHENLQLAALPSLRSQIVPAPPPEHDGRVKSGTGFFVSPAGFLMTSAHVVEGCSELTVWPAAGAALKARAIGIEPKLDLAVLSVKGPAPGYAVLRDRRGLKPGQSVLTIAFGVFPTKPRKAVLTWGTFAKSGVVSARDHVLIVRAKLHPGNSGGPVVDSSGSLVGMVFGRYGDDPDLGVAVTSREIREFLSREGVKTVDEQEASLRPQSPSEAVSRMAALVQCTGGKG